MKWSKDTQLQKLYQALAAFTTSLLVSNTKIGTKVVSEQLDHSFVFNLQTDEIIKECLFMNMSIGVFLYLIYCSNPWIILVKEANVENKDFQVRFMHTCYPSRSYYWPSRDAGMLIINNKCWALSTNLLLMINIPPTVTGRQYNINEIERQSIEESWTNLKPEN